MKDLPDGARVAIPNDPTNGGRALLVLQSAGLIKLRDGALITATPQDITENKKNLQFSELEAPQLPRSLEDADISVININFALEAKLNPKMPSSPKAAIPHTQTLSLSVKEMKTALKSKTDRSPYQPGIQRFHREEIQRRHQSRLLIKQKKISR